MRVVHIGFPKTATTFLQTAVFPRVHDTFAYFDHESSAPLFMPLMNRDDTIFDLQGSIRQFDDVCASKENSLFSYEPLTGLHYQTGFVNRSLIASRLRRLAFDRVIITIRNQFDALDSAYGQYVKSGGVLRFSDYIQFDANRPQYLYPEYFDYAAIFRLYTDLFGRENVLVIQQEKLGDDSFTDELCRFLEVRPFHIDNRIRINVSLSRDKTALLRLINHFTYNSYRPSCLISHRFSTAAFHRCLLAIPLWNRRKSFLDPAKRELVAAFYRQSNRRLQEDAGIVLASEYP